jgi:phosphoserine phosphatase RsbU/P
MPKVSGLDYHGECRPASPATPAGGDFFDFVPLEGGNLAISLGELLGCNAGGPVLLSGLRASLHGFAESGRGKLSATVEMLNRAVWEMSPGELYTRLFYARLDAATRTVTYVSAGHEPVLLVRRRPARVRRLETTGPVMGLTRSAQYRQLTVGLEPGDLLVAFSGGIAEAVNARGREWTDGGVLEVVNQTPDARAADLARDILTEVDRFTGHVRFKSHGREPVWEEHAEEPMFAAA